MLRFERVALDLVGHRQGADAWQKSQPRQPRTDDEEGATKQTPLLFPSSRGTHRFPAMLKAPLARCCARAGVTKRLAAHCLRKTANNLIRQAAGDVVARAMVGHATGEMTFTYSSVDAAERNRAHRAAFGTAFNEPGKPVN